MLALLNAIRLIWYNHIVRYDNVIKQDSVFALKGQNEQPNVDNIS